VDRTKALAMPIPAVAVTSWWRGGGVATVMRGSFRWILDESLAQLVVGADNDGARVRHIPSWRRR
jgi:hypothetical protein